MFLQGSRKASNSSHILTTARLVPREGYECDGRRAVQFCIEAEKDPPLCAPA